MSLCRTLGGELEELYELRHTSLAVQKMSGCCQKNERSMSASLRKRPKCCVAAKRRYVPEPDSCAAAKNILTRSPRRQASFGVRMSASASHGHSVARG